MPRPHVRPLRASRLAPVLALASFALALGAAPAHAQDPTPPHGYMQVVSANPFGLLLEFFNAEYERVVTPSSAVGFGGSTIKWDNRRYTNADVFWRFYPSGVPFDGWAFGAKVGITGISDASNYFGFGFDVNRSWLLGASNNFYVGVGFGLKRLVGASEVDNAPAVIPTVRIVNVGFAF
jgi:hypothetical protein